MIMYTYSAGTFATNPDAHHKHQDDYGGERDLRDGRNKPENNSGE
jgi:hypothetical protein